MPQLLGLMTEFYDETGSPMDPDTARRAFVELLDIPSLGGVWLAERDGEPAGYIVLTLGFSLEYGGRDAFVDDLFVRPGARDSGIGGGLLDVVTDECRRLGVRALHLEVARSNKRARALYLSRGFRDTNRQLLTLLV